MHANVPRPIACADAFCVVSRAQQASMTVNDNVSIIILCMGFFSPLGCHLFFKVSRTILPRSARLKLEALHLLPWSAEHATPSHAEPRHLSHTNSNQQLRGCGTGAAAGNARATRRRHCSQKIRQNLADAHRYGAGCISACLLAGDFSTLLPDKNLPSGAG